MSTYLKDALVKLDELLAPWKDRVDKPPFTLAELAVIAVLHRPDLELEPGHIADWIEENVGFYRDGGCPRYDCNWACTIQPLINRLEVPLKSRGSEINSWSCFLQTDASEALLFLRAHLHGHSNVLACRPFPFSDLPADLRLLVFELALGFPKSGIQIFREKNYDRGREELEAMIFTRTKDYSKDKWHWGSCIIKCGSLNQNLSILRVSKQMYRESMPVFYSMNHFRCSNSAQLFTLLTRTPRHRRQYIREVTIENAAWDCHSPRYTRRAFEMLRQLNLRKFGLKFPVESGLKREGALNAKDWQPSDIDGFSVLREIRGVEELTIFPECNKIRQYLEPEMTKPRGVKAENGVEAEEAEGVVKSGKTDEN